MRFRIREGFRLFQNRDDAEAFRTAGERSGVKPRASGGDIVELTLDQVRPIDHAGSLGMLEPVDDAARALYGDTKPLVARAISDPASTIPPTDDPPRREVILPSRCPTCGR